MIARAMFKDGWEQRIEQGEASLDQLRVQLADLTKQADRLLERIIESDNSSIITAYERKIAAIENEKLLVSEKLAEHGKPHHAFDDLFELALRFLSSPWDLWTSGHYHLRRIVLRLAFLDRVKYDRQNGFSNVKISLPFNILRSIECQKSEMARPKRFELLLYFAGVRSRLLTDILLNEMLRRKDWHSLAKRALLWRESGLRIGPAAQHC